MTQAFKKGDKVFVWGISESAPQGIAKGKIIGKDKTKPNWWQVRVAGKTLEINEEIMRRKNGIDNR